MLLLKKILFVILVMSFLTISTVPVFAAESEVYGKTEKYTWTEEDYDGTRPVKESGTINTIGIKHTNKFSNKALLETKFEIFGGDVDYDGSTWGGTPVKSTTQYRDGHKLEVLYKEPISDMSNEKTSTYGFFGLGYRKWDRETLSTTNAIGYKEKWKSIYTKLGVSQENPSSFWELGFKLPLYNENRVDEFDVTIHPGRPTSFFAECGFKSKSAKISFTYENMRFTQSWPKNAVVSNNNRLVYQPKSDAELYGLNISVLF